ncbi:MAG: endonuclease/exonuclease/phosphatase family protein [Gammaproteobacteria bacterium]|nr:endonuclease/exonuclease/phosphatase family protein [Gammaproteobacteria bacterium]
MGSIAYAAATNDDEPPRAAHTLRIATYNASLNRDTDGALVRSLGTRDASGRGADPQARVIAEVLQRVAPDVLLINEFDYDAAGVALRLFDERYLRAPWNGAPALRFRERFAPPVNTGVPSRVDLDRDGRIAGPNDALGFGLFPGQYGLAVYSKYSPAALAVLPLSSKNHVDLPLRLPNGRTLHFLVSHPTPPAFDGPEDRNGRRNHDEIRLWADYLSPEKAGYLLDDQGRRGGLAADASFVIVGDLNADPDDGGSYQNAIRQLLDHPRVNAEVARGSWRPRSAGGLAAAQRQGGANLTQHADPRFDTADFGDNGDDAPGNLRADYVLPSKDLQVCASGVFWPTPAEPMWRLVNDDVRASSDHRLVWVDVALPGFTCPSPAR